MADQKPNQYTEVVADKSSAKKDKAPMPPAADKSKKTEGSIGSK